MSKLARNHARKHFSVIAFCSISLVSLCASACMPSRTDSTGSLAILQYALPYLTLGELDATFAGPGYTVYTPSGGVTINEDANGIAFDEIGNIYIAGPRDSGDGSPVGAADVAIWRYTPSGILDTTWGAGLGYVSHKDAGAGNGSDIANDMVRDSAGRFVVVGTTVENGSGHTDIAVWRFNTDGTLDTSFNGRGFIVFGNFTVNGQADIASAVALGSAGRIIVAGSANNGFANTDIIVWRFTSSGTLDTTFASVGYFISSGAAGGIGNDAAQDVIVDAHGRIVVTGHSTNGLGDQDMTILRLDATGTPDATFGTAGIVVHAGAAGGTNANDSGTGVYIQGDKIVVCGGSINNAADFDMTLWRFTDAGILDTTFGGGGFIVTGDPIVAGFDNANHMVPDAWGNIVVVGTVTGSGGNSDMIVRRYSADGVPDGSFASGGFLTHDNAAGGASIDFGSRVAIDGLGRILIGGTSTDTTPIRKMTLWRVR